MFKLAEILIEPSPTPLWVMLKQIGVDEVVGVLPRGYADWRHASIDHPWHYAPLAVYRDMVEAEGFRLVAIEDNPPMDAIRYGGPGASEELDEVVRFVRTLGRLGIGVWCYNWAAALGWMRTSRRHGRGGATVWGYDHSIVKEAGPPRAGPVAADTLWRTLRHFLDVVVPVAEEAGVKLALHPDDPPVIPTIRGVDRIMGSVAAFERLLEMNRSEANGITLCQGNFTLMTDDLPSAIAHFVGTRRVYFVHFRDVMGTATEFVETFVHEGKTDMAACMRAYLDTGFDGIMRCDHTPTLAGDDAAVPGYSALGRLHAVGYMQGLRAALSTRT
jgi:mannonate dehydratase